MGERSKRKSSRPREWETLKTQVEPLPRMGNAQNTSRAAPRMGNAQNAGRAAPENGKRSKTQVEPPLRMGNAQNKSSDEVPRAGGGVRDGKQPSN